VVLNLCLYYCQTEKRHPTFDRFISVGWRFGESLLIWLPGLLLLFGPRGLFTFYLDISG
jgi:hypothetical protein